jgi:hypothetical protein
MDSSQFVPGARVTLRDWFLLKGAEQNAARYSAPQRELVRRHFQAAKRWLDPARDMKMQARGAASLMLYSKGAFELLAAVFAAHGQSAPIRVEVSSAGAKLAQLVADGRLPAPPGPLAPLEELLHQPTEAAETESTDGLPRMLVRLDRIDELLSWLARSIEWRTPEEIRRARALRVGALALIGGIAAALAITSWRHDRNVALGKEVTCSPLAFGSQPVGAVDGNKDGMFGFHTNGTDAGWLQIDLGRLYAISSISVYGRGDCCFDQNLPLTLAVSEDGLAFSDVETRETPFSEASPWVVRLPRTTARYVKVHRQSVGFLVLSEVEVRARKAERQ